MLQLAHTQNLTPMLEQPDIIDEYALLQRILEGDMLAFEAFYKFYYPKLFRFIQRLTHQIENVEELIQETLLVVWQKPEQFNHESKLSTWVFGIAYNKALKSMANNAHSQYTDIDELSAVIGDTAVNLAQSHENEDWLSCALAVLPPDQRAVIELTYYQGLSYQDIAKILNCPENTVKTRMFHARKKLQAFAETHGN